MKIQYKRENICSAKRIKYKYTGESKYIQCGENK